MLHLGLFALWCLLTCLVGLAVFFVFHPARVVWLAIGIAWIGAEVPVAMWANRLAFRFHGEAEAVCSHIWQARFSLHEYMESGNPPALRRARRTLLRLPLGFRDGNRLSRAIRYLSHRRISDAMDMLILEQNGLFYWFAPSEEMRRIATGIYLFGTMGPLLRDRDGIQMTIEGLDVFLEMVFHAFLVSSQAQLPPIVEDQKDELVQNTLDAPVRLSEIGFTLSTHYGNQVLQTIDEGTFPPQRRTYTALLWAAAVLGWAGFVSILCMVGMAFYDVSRSAAFTSWLAVTFAPVCVSIGLVHVGPQAIRRDG